MMGIILSKNSRPARWFQQSLFFAAWLLVASMPSSSIAYDILIGTGEAGSFSHFTGRAISRIINKQFDDLQCTVVPAASQVHNLTNLQGGSLDICLVDSRTLYDAVAGKGSFQFLDITYDSLRDVVAVYDIPISFVVNSREKVDSLDDLKGKRINAGAPGSPQHFMVKTVMKVKNWSEEDFSLIEELSPSHSQDTMAFCHGAIQAMVHIGVHPDPALQQLFRLCQARLLNIGQADIEILLRAHPAFIKTEIAADTYPSFPVGITTFGTKMKLIASDSLDEETVYNLLDALYRGRKYLKSAHPALGALAERSWEKPNAGLELHSGAVKFFSKQGP